MVKKSTHETEEEMIAVWRVNPQAPFPSLLLSVEYRHSGHERSPRGGAMSDSLDERRKALENDYFQKKNQEALERIAHRQEDQEKRKSPITGEPLEQITIMGVIVDQCPSSKGIWLDAGELEQILSAVKEQESESGKNLIADFFATLSGK
ncbi:hypothetical protein EBR25_01520 [bacterium]|nr:hypothetical protein [bacterium]